MPGIPDFQPLYRQVREVFLRRIAERIWPPGEALPSETALAGELGVSQGTVRKALDSLVAEDLVERHQGKGTFVAEVTPARSLFKFFRFARPGGDRVTPEGREAAANERSANAREARKLGLDPGDGVIEVLSVRRIGGRPVLRETIVVPVALFSGLDSEPIPGELYTHYHHKYGVSVRSTCDELRAVLAGADDAQYLDVANGDPLLEIERTAFDIDGIPVEWRVTRCVTDNLIYAVALK